MMRRNIKIVVYFKEQWKGKSNRNYSTKDRIYNKQVIVFT
jgi:hypothetical protein